MATNDGGPEEVPFWRRKSLEEMTDSEWESLCDGCGKCCLNKLEEEEGAAETYLHRRRLPAAGRRNLPLPRLRAPARPGRRLRAADAARRLKTINWLPPSCAYVLLAEGKDLYWWHPLVSGDPETVHTAGVSVRGRVGASEADVPDEDLEDHIVNWPLKLPKRARRR